MLRSSLGKKAIAPIEFSPQREKRNPHQDHGWLECLAIVVLLRTCFNATVLVELQYARCVHGAKAPLPITQELGATPAWAVASKKQNSADNLHPITPCSRLCAGCPRMSRSTELHTHAHACAHACMHARTCAHTHTHTHSHTHAHTHTHLRMCANTPTHIHTHTHWLTLTHPPPAPIISGQF